MLLPHFLHHLGYPFRQVLAELVSTKVNTQLCGIVLIIPGVNGIEFLPRVARVRGVSKPPGVILPAFHDDIRNFCDAGFVTGVAQPQANPLSEFSLCCREIWSRVIGVLGVFVTAESFVCEGGRCGLLVRSLSPMRVKFCVDVDHEGVWVGEQYIAEVRVS